MSGCGPHPDSLLQAGRHSARRGDWLPLAGILLVCALPRIWLIAHTEMIAEDGTIYLRMAREWRVSPRQVVEGYDYHVGYPAAVETVQRVRETLGGGASLRDWEISGQIVSMVASLVAMAGLWGFSIVTFDRRIATVTALLFGLGSKWVKLGAEMLSDSLADCFQMWAFVLAVLALRAVQKKSYWSLALAAGMGLCGGLGYQARPEALLSVALGMGLWLAFQVFRPVSWRLTLAGAGAAAAAAAAAALPYAMAIGRLTKKKRLGDIVDLAPSPQRALAMVGIDPGSISSVIPRAAVSLWELVGGVFDAMHPLLAGLACLWLAGWAAERVLQKRLPPWRAPFPRSQPAGGLLMAGALLLYGGVAFGLRFHVGYLSHRHVMPLAMILSPLAAAGLVATVENAVIVAHLRGVWRRASMIGAVAAIAVALAIHCRHPLHEGKGYFRQAARAAAALVGEGDFIACDSSWVLHYSERPGAVLPSRLDRLTPAMLSEWLKTSGANYLEVSDRELAKAAAATRAVIAAPRFVQVEAIAGPPSRHPDVVRIYRIQRDR